jgi:4-amino-4-deoxy-L-arabinose transferase-like glycosyltransferase
LKFWNAQRSARVLVGAEVAALVAFFWYALVAKDIYDDIPEFGPHEDVVRYVAWNTCAKEALLAVVLIWLVAIGRAVYEYTRARKSLSDLDRYRPRPLVTVALLLPVAGFVMAFILGLYLPKD